MKKILSMVCIFSLLFAMTACGSQSNGTDSTAESSVLQTDEAQAVSSVPSSEEEEDEQADAEPESNAKILVAYFSATGTTKILAFCTSGGSGIGSSAKNLHGLEASDVTWLDGERNFNEEFYLLLAANGENKILNRFLRETLQVQKRIYAKHWWQDQKTLDTQANAVPHMKIYQALCDGSLEQCLDALKQDITGGF